MTVASPIVSEYRGRGSQPLRALTDNELNRAHNAVNFRGDVIISDHIFWCMETTSAT